MGRGARRRRLLARGWYFGAVDAHAQPIAHQLDRPLPGGMAVDLGVALVEARARGGKRSLGQKRSPNRPSSGVRNS